MGKRLGTQFETKGPQRNDRYQLVLFGLDRQRYALHLGVVERVVPAVELTPLPKAPEIVLGVFNLAGRIVPVVNVRRRFRQPERAIDLADHLLVAHTRKRAVALWVDSALTVAEVTEMDLVTTEAIVPGLEYLEGVAKLDGGMILIHDLDKFLSLEEEKALTSALEKLDSEK